MQRMPVRISVLISLINIMEGMHQSIITIQISSLWALMLPVCFLSVLSHCSYTSSCLRAPYGTIFIWFVLEILSL